MATIEEIEDMLGDEFPKDVKGDDYYEKEFLIIMNGTLAQYGEAWVREHKTMLNSQWECVRTLV